MSDPTDADDPAAVDVCAICDGIVHWVDCPTGGWWSHEIHPEDDHDAAVERHDPRI